jgi:predicted nucleic acid-binding protein
MLAELHQRMRQDGSSTRACTRALELAGEHNLWATHDAHYLALAERLRAPSWTRDRRLAKKANGGAPVMHLVP